MYEKYSTRGRLIQHEGEANYSTRGRLILCQEHQNSPELLLLNFFTINLPSQPFLGRHLGFHIFFHHSLSEGCTLFTAWLFWFIFHFFLYLYTPKPAYGRLWDFLNLSFFSFPQEQKKMKQMLNTLNISDFISKCTNYIYNTYIYYRTLGTWWFLCN